VTFFVSFMFLMSWARYQSESLRCLDPASISLIFSVQLSSLCSDNLRTNGYFSSTKFVIFPVHLKILAILGFTALFQALMLMSFRVIDSTEKDDDIAQVEISYIFAILRSISFGATHVVTGLNLHVSSCTFCIFCF